MEGSRRSGVCKKRLLLVAVVSCLCLGFILNRWTLNNYVFTPQFSNVRRFTNASDPKECLETNICNNFVYINTIVPEPLLDFTNCLETNVCKIKPYVYKDPPNIYETIDNGINLKANGTNVEPVVPHLVHFTWYVGGKRGNHFRLHHMMSVLSAHKFLKPKKIYFWHDTIPTGDYWKEINDKVPELFLIYRAPPKEIRGRKIEVPEHMSDVVRLEAIIQYGGMYFDLDVMVLRDLDPLLKFDATMGYESEVKDGALCNGVMIGKPWADFYRHWHKQYSTFEDSNWGYHSVLLPGKLAVQYPNLIHTEEKSIHRPNGLDPGYLYGKGKIWNWRNKNYVSHLYYRTHNVEHSLQDIKTWNTTVGQMWRWIYYGDWKIKTK